MLTPIVHAIGNQARVGFYTTKNICIRKGDIISMPTLYDSLWEVAKLDFTVAKALTKQGFYAHALFYFEQAFEKAIKSLLASYQIESQRKHSTDVEEYLKTISHNSRYPTFTIVEMLFDLYPSSRKASYERLTGITVKNIEETIQRLKTKDLEAQEIVDYPAYMDRLNNLKNEWLFSSPDIDFKFVVLASILSMALVFMESYTRYPIGKYNYTNVKLFNDKSNHMACQYITDMMEDFFDIIPVFRDTVATRFNETTNKERNDKE